MNAYFLIATLILQACGMIAYGIQGKYAVAVICAAGVLAQIGSLMMARAA
jgi:hypothetical protein